VQWGQCITGLVVMGASIKDVPYKKDIFDMSLSVDFLPPEKDIP